MTQSVSLALASEEDRGRVRAVLASLPVDFRESEQPNADVRVVSGTGTWVENVRVAVQDGARLLVVMDPSPEEPRSLRALAEQVEASQTVVVLAERFAGNPVFDLIEANLIPRELLTVTAQAQTHDGAGYQRLLLETLRVLHVLGLRPTLTTSAGATHGVTIGGRLGEVPVALIASDGPSTQLRVTVTGSDRELDLTLYSADTARPARAISAGIENGVAVPTVYESAYRAAFLHVGGATTGGEALRAFADDTEIIERGWRR